MLAAMHHRLSGHGGQDVLFSGRGSRIYDRIAGILLRRLYQRVAAEVDAAVPSGAAVLDVGTGPGRLLVELARRRPDLRLTGVDLSADMVAIAQRNVRRAGQEGQVEVRRADVAALPFEDGAFDLVVSTLSLHHWGVVRVAVTELARVLRPGGALWIYDLHSVADVLVAAADEAFPGRPLRPTFLGGGRLHLRPVVRWTVERPPAAA